MLLSKLILLSFPGNVIKSTMRPARQFTCPTVHMKSNCITSVSHPMTAMMMMHAKVITSAHQMTMVVLMMILKSNSINLSPSTTPSTISDNVQLSTPRIALRYFSSLKILLEKLNIVADVFLSLPKRRSIAAPFSFLKTHPLS